MIRWRYGNRFEVAPVVGAPALDFKCACAGYGRMPVVKGLSFTLPTGKRLALVGPNGCGKSTLLKTVAGLHPVMGGAVRVFGRPPAACHHRVAYVPQHKKLEWAFPITVDRVVAGGRMVHRGWLGRYRKEDKERVCWAMEKLSLNELADRSLGMLSGGERQRVLIARALAQEADLLLLDEPLNAVDGSSRKKLAAVLAAVSLLGKTVVMATHDRGYLERDFDSILDMA